MRQGHELDASALGQAHGAMGNAPGHQMIKGRDAEVGQKVLGCMTSVATNTFLFGGAAALLPHLGRYAPSAIASLKRGYAGFGTLWGAFGCWP